jgi:serine/threonine protein kinase
MELLRGSDLGALLRREYRMGVVEILEMAHDVAHALDAAHRAGVVHRDLKPQNVFRVNKTTPDGPGWKVLDFGVCSLPGSTGTLTDRELVGTPHYMSPEQAQGSKGDHRTDVFAMGVLLYRVLTGQLPFAGEGHAVLYAVVNEAPLRPREIAPWIPPDVERVLAIALAKTPAERFDSAVELADALRAAVNEELPDETRVRADELLRRAPWRREAVTTVVAGRRCLSLDASAEVAARPSDA